MKLFPVVLIYVAALLFSQGATAGTWGVGSFENDTALDWAYELTAAKSTSVIYAALRSVSKTGYVGVDDCARALAAAEVVAALKTHKMSSLPPEVARWAEKHKGLYKTDLKTIALNAVASCENPEHSEWAQLWTDSAPKDRSAYLMVLKIKLR